MNIHRVEQNVSTGEVEVIDQIAYRNEAGDVLVLDAIETSPPGYVAFDPADEVPEAEE